MSSAKLSLREIDIVIPFRESSDERRENLYAVLAHLALTYSDYRIWLIEADAAPKFNWARAGDVNVRHVFVPHNGRFPKAALCNMGVRLSRGPVVCFHDADSIGNPRQIMSCIAGMFDGYESDALCPYWDVINVGGAVKQAFIESPRFEHFASLDAANLVTDTQVMYMRANGGIVFFRRGAYVRVGGYNEQLEGWGGEDNELFSRATRLGLRWHSFPVPLIHLHHDTPSRQQALADASMSANVLAERAAATMPIDELAAMASRLSEDFQIPAFSAKKQR